MQLVLDRVLGPGNGVVAVSQTIRSSTSTTTSVRWGPAVASSSVVTPGAVGQQDLVSGTSTMTVTPPGALVRQSVSVAVDRAHLGGVRIGALRQLIAAAAGVVPSRGDTLSVVVARFAGPSAVKPPTTSIATVLMPYVVPAVWAIGGLVALLVVARSFRRRPRGQAVLRRL